MTAAGGSTATILALATALMLSAIPARARPLATMGEVGSAILACWTPPAGTHGDAVTLSFAFRSDGTLIGRPRPTDIAFDGKEDARRKFVEAAIGAVRDCVPLALSDRLAGGIGGHVFTLRFKGSRN